MQVREDENLWADTVKFVDTILTDDAEEKFVQHCKEKEFNQNEVILIRHFVEQAVNLKMLTAQLKHLSK